MKTSKHLLLVIGTKLFAAISLALLFDSCKKDKHPREIVVSNFAGTGIFGYNDGPANMAQFNYPTGLTFDGQGNMYVADPFANRIRKVTPSGVVSTFAGSGTAGMVNGAGGAAQFHWPYGVACDPAGNVYVVELMNHSIRKITSTVIRKASIEYLS